MIPTEPTEFPTPEDLRTLFESFNCTDEDALAEAVDRLTQTVDYSDYE